MTQLNFFYQLPLKTAKFIDRKFAITEPKTLIVGASGSGKTALMCEYLANFRVEERLYLNLADLRADSVQILRNLGEFLTQNPKIKAVGIENLTDAAQLEILQNLACENIIITTDRRDLAGQISNLHGLVKAEQSVTNTQPDKFDTLNSESHQNFQATTPKNAQNFTLLNLRYLDYEEFLALFRKNLDAEMLFSHFLAHGGAVKSAFLDASEIAESLQNVLKKELSPQNIALLAQCAQKCAEPTSAHEIYKNLKERVKISKDSVYAGLAELENRGFIAYALKFSEPNAAKKLYFCDFALRNALNLKKDFAKLFANVVFCELAKFEEPIFYTKEFDFFLAKRKLALLCVPFGDSDLIFLKFKKLHQNLKNLGITKLQVISVGNSAELAIEGIKCEILPFTRWALSI